MGVLLDFLIAYIFFFRNLKKKS